MCVDENISSSNFVPSSRLCLLIIKSWACGLWAHFNTCTASTRPLSYYCHIFLHYTSLNSNIASFHHTLNVINISSKISKLNLSKLHSVEYIILSMSQLPSQVTTTLEMHKFFHRPYFSYPRNWSKSLFIEQQLIQFNIWNYDTLTLLIHEFITTSESPIT